MTDQQIDRLLTRLEHDHQDDLNLVCQFDMIYFSTECLEDMYAHWHTRSEKLHTFHKSNLQIIAFTALAMLLGAVGFALEIVYLMPFFYVAILTLLASFFSLLYLNRNFGSIRNNNRIGQKIRAELHRRYNTLYI
ncbi:MAG: hypothetical protein AAF738_05380 [Bacteroidota bacterium]